jgi:hypothetical protein
VPTRAIKKSSTPSLSKSPASATTVGPVVPVTFMPLMGDVNAPIRFTLLNVVPGPWPKTTAASTPMDVVWAEEPTSTSGHPSPFTSPARDTYQPMRSPASAPPTRKPCAVLATETAAVLVVPKTTKAHPLATSPFALANGAPMTKSSSPSPLTSPRLLTVCPICSEAVPCARNPDGPVCVAYGKLLKLIWVE